MDSQCLKFIAGLAAAMALEEGFVLDLDYLSTFNLAESLLLVL
jgi:hypothetical protein